MRTLLLVSLIAIGGLLVWLLTQGQPLDGPLPPHPGGDTAAPAPLASQAPELQPPPPVAPALPGVHPPAVPELPADAPRVVGIVVDAQYRPLEGASVVAVLEGKEIRRMSTGPDGRFVLALVPRAAVAQRGVLHVRRGRIGVDAPLSVHIDTPDRVSYRHVVLHAQQVLRVRVVHEGAPVAGATVVVGEPQARAPRVEATTDADGRVRIEAVVRAGAAAFAVAPGFGRGHARIPPASEDRPREVIEIELPADRRATLRVKHGVTGEPVPGAEVFVAGGGTFPPPRGSGCLPPHPPLRAGEHGTVEVAGLPRGHVMLVARAPGLAMRSNGMMPERLALGPDDTEVEVTLWPYRTLRFPIATSDTAAPVDGTPLTLRRYQALDGYDEGHAAARIDDGHLVLEPFPPGHDQGHVVTDDGRWARWQTPIGGDLGEPITFATVQELKVRLLWRDGTPAAGQWLQLILRPRGRRSVHKTDASGRIAVPRVIAETVSVLWTGSGTGFGSPLGTVNLLSDPGEVELRLDRPIEIVLTVRQGARLAVPRGLEVRVPDLDPDVSFPRSRDVRSELRGDWSRGEVRFTWLPMPDGSPPPVTLRADGVPPKTVTPERGEDGIFRGEVNLTSGATLIVPITPPQEGRYYLRFSRWDPKHERWLSLHDHPGFRAGRRALEGVHTIPGLAPGRYRISEGYTGLATAPIDIEGPGAIEVPFDLSLIVRVTGQVTVPDGEDASHAAVHVEGRTEGQLSPSNPQRVRASGTFEIRGVKGERLPLVITHPLLRSAERVTTFVVGQGTPALELLPDAQLRFRIEGDERTTPAPGGNASVMHAAPVTVRFHPPGRWDAQAPTERTLAPRGHHRCRVPGPGTYHVEVSVPGKAPLIVRGVEIGPDVTDLGALTPQDGATLTVSLRAGTRPIPARARIRVRHTGGLPYARWGAVLKPGTPPTIEVKGLGPGPFEVEVLKLGLRGVPIGTASVESDGTSALSVDVRLQ